MSATSNAGPGNVTKNVHTAGDVTSNLAKTTALAAAELFAANGLVTSSHVNTAVAAAYQTIAAAAAGNATAATHAAAVSVAEVRPWACDAIHML